ncbi:MAG: HAMP domain-containing histidine kinase, partial [Clostridia bacterium]|nr:HAMP domain-containing histidine kinase [Clostridia bacterium]
MRKISPHKKRSSRLGIQLLFSLVILIMILITMFSAIWITYTINRVSGRIIKIPMMVWMIGFSLIISAIFCFFLYRKIFRPITRLERAMKQVAGGDFSPELKTKSYISEIRNLYDSFNIMTTELRATEILQTDFVSNVSHEIKTPISAIDGYTTLLQDSTLTAAEREKYIEKILFNTRRLSVLVGNILLLSKVDNKTISGQRSLYRLDEQIRQVIVSFEEKWSEKDLELDVDLDSIEYFGDEGLLWHVWSNLIDNAVKFSPTCGLIRIRLEKLPLGNRFTIDDCGPGISPEAQKHIFDKFYQSDSSHKAEGNGLGLALVKRILDLCGGEVETE